MSILALNAGSSTLKFGLFDDTARDEFVSGLFDWGTGAAPARLVFRHGGDTEHVELSASDARRPVVFLVNAMTQGRWRGALKSPIGLVGHRIVHGGSRFRQSILADERVRAELREVSKLAPLHNPPALEVMDSARDALPDAPHVAVFDTAFFARLPPQAYLYPVPYEWFTRWGIRRFGFHGISHAYCTERVAEILGRPVSELRLVTCHLGNGCSATAVQGGRAIATSMGFTPMDGLMMGTRPGSLDPGVLLHLLQDGHLSAADLEDTLNHASGLRGISGVSSDYREVEQAASRGHERARLALDLYAARVIEGIGALVAALAGIDALVFTAGVGENSVSLRRAVCHHLRYLGLQIDPELNGSNQPDADIAARDSSVSVLVIKAREELAIARDALRVVLHAT